MKNGGQLVGVSLLNLMALFGQLIGVCLVLVGLVLLPLPIPLGMLLTLMGLTILIALNKTIANSVKRFRTRHGRFDRAVRKVERFLPPLRNTQPDSES